MSDGSLLDVRDLSKSFRGEEVLRNASLQVQPGRVLGFVGPNGAGKSTCLRCILGLCFPDTGSVRIAGLDARRDPVGARSRTGYLPGETSLYAGMRGDELLGFGLAFHPEIDTEVRDHCLDRFRLPLRRRIRTWSAGQKQLLALTLALAPRVPLYILDEPDKALDASMRHELRAILRRLKAQGKGLLVSSHHIAELEGIADDYTFLLDGELIGHDRIERERRRVENEVRATFRETEPAFSLPEGTRIDHDDDAYVFTPAEGTEIVAVVQALLPLRPTSLDYGHASLQEIYEALYLNRQP